MKGAPHLPQLTGLRGIAAWFVVLFHARASLTAWLPDWAATVAAQGYLAVDLFFMLSGFVMWLNYGPRLRAEGLAGAPAFWWRRFARIWPLHGAVSAMLLLFALTLFATGRDRSGYPFAELPLHLLLVQNWGFTSALSWNHPAWSISTEMGAYLLFPFAVIAIPWERLQTGVLAAVVLTLALTLWGAYSFAGAGGIGDQIPQLGLIRCLVQFFIGLALANLWQVWRDKRSSAWFYVLATMAGALIVTGMLSQTLLVPLAFAALLLALAIDHGPLARLLSTRPLVWLGDASYATYLIHFPLLVLVKLLAAGIDAQLDLLMFAAYSLVLLALSGMTYRWLEQPAQTWLNRRRPGIFSTAPVPG